ncbi:hypothetical protein CDD81_2565 [Ophiocordyceps australis]|uniref:Uncharacterized protein n=1 Tax=Ophiocordyceps australis TaxID=1399860 RepID=A0A2C5XEL9_9HYPO|nr:hypothetical protein CDD81_2565 [Ophiocordyceps australis]
MASTSPRLGYFPPPQSSSSSSVETYDSLLSLAPCPPATSSASLAAPRARHAGATPSDATSFARLFPSRHRLAIRLDDAAADGMNVRVDTEAAPGHAVQLFHLRMRNLARRDFSLRRYARASGREVCSSSRAFAPAPSVAFALRSLRRASLSSMHSFAASAEHVAASSSSLASSDCIAEATQAADVHGLVPTDTIRLEFTNYARVDLHRRSRRAVRYSFEWWGRKYAWRRAVDKTLGSVAWHLVCQGAAEPVAHVVPDLRSPSQVDADKRAGVWLPPCYMWISDQSIVDALTDVADVVVATGLIALVDDCILNRWPLDNKPHALDPEPTPIKSGLRALFSRKPSAEHPHSPLRLQNTVAVC